MEPINSSEATEIVKKSFDRAILSGDVMTRFYEVFLQSHPEIKSMFAHTDFDQQKQLFRHGIDHLILFSEGNAIGKSGITEIAKVHNMGHMNVRPHLYQYWEQCLYQTISEFDAEFDQKTETAWKEVIGKGVEFIKGRYDSE